MRNFKTACFLWRIFGKRDRSDRHWTRRIEKVYFDGAYYLGVITSDGDEWGEPEDLKADKYLVIPLLKPSNK